MLLSTYLAAPRLATIRQALGVSLGVAATGMAITAWLWPGRAAGIDDLDVGLRGLSM